MSALRQVTAYSCPANSTLAGTSCRCSGGYAVNSTGNGCIPIPVEEASCAIGNPALPGTGRKLHEETDYAGAGAAPLSIRRYYRSAWTDGAFATGAATIAAWGAGWRLSVHANLAVLPGGAVRAFRPDGSTVAFDASTSTPHTWTAAASRDKLSAVLNANGQRTGFTYTAFADDSVETYDTDGKLQSMRQRNGWTNTLSYNAVGQVTSVRNAFGREVGFSYNAQGRLSELLPPGAVAGTAAGSATSPIRYAYGEIASLGPGVAAQGQLSSVTWQDGNVRRYHYEDPRFPQALTGITDEAGVRYASYAYDSAGRVARSEHVGGVDRVDFGYATNASGSPTTVVTDYSTGGATTRTYTFQSTGGVIRPIAVTAPCPLCGNTQASTVYDGGGNTVKTIGHDGRVTFYAYDTKGRETERATFPASYQGATARPALSLASKVVSTKWHATWNLPTQIAEPNKTTANTYSSKGMLTGQSWTATTDATGAAKFTAVKTGSTYATGWGYNANSLNTSVVEKTDSVETGHWTMAYNALGDVTRVTDVTNGNRVGNATQYDPQGKLLTGTTTLGLPVAYGYSPRGFVRTRSINGQTTNFTQNPIGLTTDVLLPDSQTVRFEYDATYRLSAVRLNGALLAASAVRDGTNHRARFAIAREWMQRVVESLVRPAYAQVLPLAGPMAPGSVAAGMVLPGQSGAVAAAVLTANEYPGERPGGAGLPLFDPNTRRVVEAITRWCKCDPSGGHSKPTLTSLSYAHIAISGHLNASFADKSYFTESVNQALVDEIVSKDLRSEPPGSSPRRYFVPDMGRPVGFTRQSDGTFAQVRSVTLFVHRDNCNNLYRVRNEVITMYPGK